MGDCSFICPAKLQRTVDEHHDRTIGKWAQKTQQLNKQLREVIGPLKYEIQGRIHNPKYKGQPHDLNHLKSQFDALKEIYDHHRNEFQQEFPQEMSAIEEKEKEESILPKDLTQISEDELHQLEQILEELHDSHRHGLEDTTSAIYRQGQLFILVAEILRRMQETQERHGRYLVMAQTSRV